MPIIDCRECANGQTDLVIGAVSCIVGFTQLSLPLIIGPSSSVNLYVKQYLTNISVCQGHTQCQCSNVYIKLANANKRHNKFEDPCSKLQEIFDRKGCCHCLNSLANPAASCGI